MAALLHLELAGRRSGDPVPDQRDPAGRLVLAMAIPPGGSGQLGAFDCLGRPITAIAPAGSGFGFSADLTAGSVTSAGPELNVPLYTGPAPNGSAVLYDDRGAVTATPVS
jgi:hypothetical protein